MASFIKTIITATAQLFPSIKYTAQNTSWCGNFVERHSFCRVRRNFRLSEQESAGKGMKNKATKSVWQAGRKPRAPQRCTKYISDHDLHEARKQVNTMRDVLIKIN